MVTQTSNFKGVKPSHALSANWLNELLTLSSFLENDLSIFSITNMSYFPNKVNIPGYLLIDIFFYTYYFLLGKLISPQRIQVLDSCHAVWWEQTCSTPKRGSKGGRGVNYWGKTTVGEWQVHRLWCLFLKFKNDNKPLVFGIPKWLLLILNHEKPETRDAAANTFNKNTNSHQRHCLSCNCTITNSNSAGRIK